MTDEELKGLGLNDDGLATLKDDLTKNFVAKSQFDEVTAAKTAMETQIADRDKQLKTLKEQVKGNNDLQSKIEALQAENSKQKESYEGKIYQMKVDNALGERH